MFLQAEEFALLSALAGVGCGAAVTALWSRARLNQTKDELQGVRGELLGVRKELALGRDALDRAERTLAELQGRRQAERESLERERALISNLREELSGHFARLSVEALDKNSDAFLRLARESLGGVTEAAKGDLQRRQQAIAETLRPVSEQLLLLERHVRALEEKRGQAYGELGEQVKNLVLAQSEMMKSTGSLRDETVRLANSLRSSSVRGRWGELQLKNVIELGGMAEHCDFEQQTTLSDADGTQQRPDVTVRLPSGHWIAVDAKAPLTAYLDAVDANSEEDRTRCIRQHATAIRAHCQSLGRKAYWQNLDPAPQFVVLFLPGEMFYSAALQVDPELLTWSLEQKVILATPTMLIALLRTIAHGWKAASIEQNAIEVRKIGLDLHKSLSVLSGHVRSMAKHLHGTVDAYNNMVGSFEQNVFSKARKFTELKIVDDEVPALPMIDQRPRALQRDYGTAEEGIKQSLFPVAEYP